MNQEDIKQEAEKADKALQSFVDERKGAGWYERAKKIFIITVLILAILATCFAIYRLWEQGHKDNSPQPQTLNLSLDGKPSSPSAPQVIRLQGTDTQTHSISYIPKYINPLTGEKEATDVQLDTGAANKIVTVKVNGKTTQVPILTTEDQKFQNGKLVVTETQSSDINITGPEPSRWQAMYARNAEGDNAIGVSYALGKVVRAGVMHVDGKAPFIMIQADLGDLCSRKKK